VESWIDTNFEINDPHYYDYGFTSTNTTTNVASGNTMSIHVDQRPGQPELLGPDLALPPHRHRGRHQRRDLQRRRHHL
jgi:hypothetical protein